MTRLCTSIALILIIQGSTNVDAFNTPRPTGISTRPRYSRAESIVAHQRVGRRPRPLGISSQTDSFLVGANRTDAIIPIVEGVPSITLMGSDFGVPVVDIPSSQGIDQATEDWLSSSFDTIEKRLEIEQANEEAGEEAPLSVPSSVEPLVEPENAPYSLPSYRSLSVFALATVAIWMSEPLLSLVDTTVVGLTQGASSVVQVASMGPATTLFDSVLYGCWFLAVATTSQVAQALAKNDYKELQSVVRNVLGVSLALGLGVTGFLFVSGPSCLHGMVAGSASAGPLVHYASQYTRIRALVAIPAIAGQVLQSICLATLNVRTPAIAVIAASVVNIIGDMILSPTLGVAGAAWATAAATLASTGILFHSVHKQMAEWKDKEVDDSASTLDTVKRKRSSRGLKSVADMFRFPNRKQFMELVRLSGPLFYAINAKVACYSALTVRCASFGVGTLAAHNIMMRIFLSFACFGYSLSQTAQSFIPSALMSGDKKKNFKSIMKRLFVMGAVMAAINQGAAFTLNNLGHCFTTDGAVIGMMRQFNKFMGWGLLLHPFTMLLEGAVIGMRDFKSLVTTYTLTLGCHFGILKFFTNSLPQVWRSFFIFQTICMGLYGSQIWMRQKAATKADNE